MDTLTKLFLETDALNRQRDKERIAQEDRIYIQEQLTRLRNNLNRDINERVDLKSRCELLIQYKEFYLKLKQESQLQGKNIKSEVCDVFIKEFIEPAYSIWKEKFNLELLTHPKIIKETQQDAQLHSMQIPVKQNVVHNEEEVSELFTTNRATKEQKERYFSLLSTTLGKNKEVILTRDQVMEFLSINFKEFRLPGAPAPEPKFFNIRAYKDFCVNGSIRLSICLQR